MSVKSILFNTEMVKAVLDGRKTQTRRIIKPQPLFFTGRHYVFDDETCPKKWEDCDNFIATAPFQTGDVLYVRETWRALEAGYPPRNSVIEYRAGGTQKFDDIVAIPTEKGEWKPSIFMPKSVARIFLRVNDVRVERLHAMKLDDIEKEGIDDVKPDEESDFLCNYCPLDEGTKGVHCYGGEPIMCEGAKCEDAMEAWVGEYTGEFAKVWDSTMPKRDIEKYGWEVNPFVWVIEFEKISKEEAIR